MHEEVLEVLGQTAKSKVCLVLCDGKKMVRKELSGNLPVYAVLQNLRHSFLPEIFQVEDQNGQTIVWEEYIEGQSLFEAKLAHKQLLAAFCELCTVLDFLHLHKIVHRDIKPSNLRLATDGHIRLLDFDAARMVKEEVEHDTRLLGTRGYAPPEQYGFSQTDERADIYALGVTMKQLLGAQANWRDKQIAARCTKQNPDDRYASVLAVRRALRYRRAFVATLVAVLVVVLLLSSFWAVFSPARSHKSDPSYISNEAAPALWGAERQDGLFGSLDAQVKGIALDGKSINEGKTAEMSDALDTRSEESYFSIGRDHPNGTKLFASYGRYGMNLAYDPWVENIPELYDDFGFIAEDFYHHQLQLYTCDLDADGTKEVLLCVGDGLSYQVAAIYQLDKKNPETPFRYCGSIGGGARLVLSEGRLYTAVGSQGRYASYRYNKGELTLLHDFNN